MQVLLPSRYIFTSILLHGLLVFLMFFVHNYRPMSSPPAPEVLNLDLVEAPQKTKKISPAKLNKKMIVDQDVVNDQFDPNANYLSSHNQKIFRETVARKHGEFQNKTTEVMRDQAFGAPSFRRRTGSQTMPGAEPKRMPLPKDFFGSYKETLARALAKSQNENQGLDRAGVEASQTRDYLPGKEEGMETLLSTREFVYYTYYNRIRDQLSQYWEPKIKQKVVALFRQGRRVASVEDRITKVQIVLDSKGLLQKVQVLGASGIQDLDDLAVEAFKAAAPFPNPPKGIIEGDGTVKIQWEFVVES